MDIVSVFLWSDVAEGSGRRPARLCVHVMKCYSDRKYSTTATVEQTTHCSEESVVQLQRTAVSFVLSLATKESIGPVLDYQSACHVSFFMTAFFCMKVLHFICKGSWVCALGGSISHNIQSRSSGTAQILHSHLTQWKNKTICTNWSWELGSYVDSF